MTIVVMISIIKDGIEDVKRHRADNRTNNRLARVVRKDVSDSIAIITILLICEAVLIYLIRFYVCQNCICLL
jgi:hypothetical protein